MIIVWHATAVFVETGRDVARCGDLEPGQWQRLRKTGCGGAQTSGKWSPQRRRRTRACFFVRVCVSRRRRRRRPLRSFCRRFYLFIFSKIVVGAAAGSEPDGRRGVDPIGVCELCGGGRVVRSCVCVCVCVCVCAPRACARISRKQNIRTHTRQTIIILRP